MWGQQVDQVATELLAPVYYLVVNIVPLVLRLHKDHYRCFRRRIRIVSGKIGTGPVLMLLGTSR